LTDEPECMTDCPHIGHEDVVKIVKGKLPEGKFVTELSGFFSLFSDDTRLKILMGLDISEMCVSCISETLGMSDSAVSHQLRILRDSNLVKSRREGKFIYYSLSDDHVKSIIETAAEHLTEDLP
jgi:DNA-binding transcriptional ArsR family regulator